MQRKLKCAVMSCAVSLLVACGGGGGDGDISNVPTTDNSSNAWIFSSNGNYSGGDVLFAGQKISGEWSTTKNSSTEGDSFNSSYNKKYLSLGVKFDSLRYYEYWSEFGISSTGKVVSNSAWTPSGSYGVNKDGTILTIDRYSSVKSYKATNVYPYRDVTCVTVIEIETNDEYDLCRVSD